MRKKKHLLLCKKAKDMWDDVKGMVGGGIMAVIAYLEPIRGEEMSLLTIFVLNFFAGYFAGRLQHLLVGEAGRGAEVEGVALVEKGTPLHRRGNGVFRVVRRAVFHRRLEGRKARRAPVHIIHFLHHSVFLRLEHSEEPEEDPQAWHKRLQGSGFPLLHPQRRVY